MQTRIRSDVRSILQAVRWGDLFLGMALAESCMLLALALWAGFHG